MCQGCSNRVSCSFCLDAEVTITSASGADFCIAKYEMAIAEKRKKVAVAA